MPSWIFEVVDHVTDAMKRMASSSENLTSKVDKSSKALDVFAKLEIGKMAYEGAKKLEEWTSEFVKFSIEVNAAKSAAMRFLGFSEGSKSLAEGEYEALVKWAKQSGQSVDAVISQQEQLAGVRRQFGEEWVHKTQEAAADVETIHKGASAAVVEAVSKISDRAKVSARSFDMLNQTGVITSREVGLAMAKELGIKGPDAATKGLERIEKMADGRAKAISLILGTIYDKVDKGAGLSAAAQEKSLHSVGDAINDIKISWEALFTDQNMQPFADSLRTIGQMLSDDSETGYELKTAIHGLGQAFDAIVGDTGTVQTGIELLTDAIEAGTAVVDLASLAWYGWGEITALATGNLDRFEAAAKKVDLVMKGMDERAFKREHPQEAKAQAANDKVWNAMVEAKDTERPEGRAVPKSG